jgi:lipopolysaccharide/colanic/teichoic acid biosynthesis glycosyltransferase
MEANTEFFARYPNATATAFFRRIAERTQNVCEEETFEYFVQRTVEIVVSLAALILTLPITLTIALIIRLGTPGNPLFFQKRVGKNGKVFRFLKFRTMYADAKQRFPELYRYAYDDDEIKKLAFKIKDDPRVTPQGRWLRKTSLDELLNFWNVLTGDMALVGPRPDIPEMLRYYEGRMLEKFNVRPGVTGLAQVSGRGDLSFLDTVKLDVQYVRNRSLKYDLEIFLRTIKSVLIRDGAF